MEDNVIVINEKNLEKNIVALLKERSNDSHKGDYGLLSVYAGSEYYRGCAALNVLAAQRTGCGIVRLCSTEKVISSVCPMIPCAVFHPLEERDGHVTTAGSDLVGSIEKATALLIGCGLTDCDDTGNLAAALLGTGLPVVLDADGLNSIRSKKNLLKRAAPTILTPHIGEMARLAGKMPEDIEENRVEYAVALSRAYGVITVLKSSKTVVTNGEDTWEIDIPNAGLAKAGSGDVLSGIIGSLLAQRYDPIEAALLGVLLHSDAGIEASDVKGVIAMLPTDVIEEL